MGRLVTTYLDPGIMETPAGVSLTRAYRIDIPLPGRLLLLPLPLRPGPALRRHKDEGRFPDPALFPAWSCGASSALARSSPRALTGRRRSIRPTLRPVLGDPWTVGELRPGLQPFLNTMIIVEKAVDILISLWELHRCPSICRFSSCWCCAAWAAIPP